MAARAPLHRLASPGILPHGRFPAPVTGPGQFLPAVILPGYLRVPKVFCNRLFFSMFSALAKEKPLFQLFVFKMFSALDTMSHEGHEVAVELGALEARKNCIIGPFVLRMQVVVERAVEAALYRHLPRQLTDKLAATRFNGATARPNHGQRLSRA